MKKRLLLVLCSLLPVLAFAQGAAPTTPRPDVEELLTVMRADKMIENMMDPLKKMLGSMSQQPGMSPEAVAKMKAGQEKIFAFVMSEMSSARMKTEIGKIYAETFTPEEIHGITAFYKSPSGQAFLDKQPILMQKTMAMSQKIMMDAMPKIQQMIKSELK